MDDMVMKSILSDNTTLEPIMRVAFSKSGTSHVTNSHASTENVQKNSACANHTDIANSHEDNKEHCCPSCANVSGIWSVRSRLFENGSVKTDLCKNNRGDKGLTITFARVLWYVPVSLLLLHCGHCLWDWTFPHGSRKQQTNVCTSQHISKQFWVWGLRACLPPRQALTYA